MNDAPAPSSTGDRTNGQRGAGRREVGERTKVKILDTALTMFAERGLDAVSINEICKQCGVNSAAVHYHFGSKAKLIEAIQARAVASWGSQRDQLIDDLEARGNPTLREVVEIMVEPTAALMEQPWGHDYVRFLSAVTNHPKYMTVSNAIADAYTMRYLALLERVVPDVDRDVLLRRYTMSRVFMYQAFSTEQGPLTTWLEQHGSSPTRPLKDDLTDFFVAGLAAPVEWATPPG